MRKSAEMDTSRKNLGDDEGKADMIASVLGMLCEAKETGCVLIYREFFEITYALIFIHLYNDF